jgi:hypothetical protein
MKIIKTISLFIIISLLSTNGFTQISGYLGKKNIISGSLFMKSSFSMPNKTGKNGYFSFNDHYSLEYERVINRISSIKLHLTSFESRYNIMGEEIVDLSELNTFSTKALGIDYLFYRNSYLAPLGIYFSAGFDVFLSDVNVDTASINNNYAYYLSGQRFEFDQINTVHLGLNFKSGVKQIFFNCISFDVNFQLGAIFAKPATVDYEFSGYSDNSATSEKYIKDVIGSRLWGHYAWGVNCSVGFVF